jgi:hypothetical protein
VDTVGFDIDIGNVILGAGKWRYRDWVIAALNADMPYDQFVTEQLAGDERVDWRSAARYSAEIRAALIATGFLRTAEDDTHEPESNIPSVRFAVLHDTLEIVGSSLLGLTLQCARCHSHKFDPIPQDDYYRLMALLTPAFNPTDWRAALAYKPGVRTRTLPDVSTAEQAEIDRRNREIDRAIAELKQRAAAIRRPYEARLSDARLATVPEPIRADTRTALDTPAAKRTGIQTYLAKKLEALLKVKPEEVTAALSAADRSALRGLDEQIAAAEGRRPRSDTIQALWDVGPPPPTYLLKRGNHETPGPEVRPGFLSVLSEPADELLLEARPQAATSGRRLALARWLTRPGSPASGLLARVLINRIWAHLFGQGLVPTPDNFGRSGAPPSHPELLEWLSAELIGNGWRIKPVIKLMMTSTVYRQASRRAPAGGEDPGTSGADPALVDPGNQLLWRMRLRRLDSEAVRDTILAVSGRLDRAMGGPPIPQEAHPDGMVVVAAQGDSSPSSRSRRSVYLVARRKFPLTLLQVFDQPIIATNCTRRDSSAVPLQSLTMLNDPFVLEHARHFADRVARPAGTAPENQVDRAFRVALSRRPSPAELSACIEFLEEQEALHRAARLAPAEAARGALASLCHTLLNTSEFLYTEPGGGQP